jgi:hypothetical protein
MLMFSLEDSIATDSFIRVVDVFVDSIDLKGFGLHMLSVMMKDARHILHQT